VLIYRYIILVYAKTTEFAERIAIALLLFYRIILRKFQDGIKS